MARLIGVTIFLWAISASFSFSLQHAPQASTTVAAGSAADEENRVSPVDAISDAVELDEAAKRENRQWVRSWPFGVYAVGESPDPYIAARDRDNRARSGELEVDQELETEDFPDHVQTFRGEITPGLYATTLDTEGCSYELHRVMKDRETRVIAEDHLAAGRLLVTINGIEPDWFTSTSHCGQWYEWRPLDEPLTQAGNGDYWIGDLASGRWVVPEPCRWEKVVGFRGGFLYDVVEGGSGPGAFTIDADTLGVRVRGCRSPMTNSAPYVSYDAP